ncbi:MAG: hypothetical protein LBE78_12880 [Burkholderiaceae bacterium]|jgi:sulfur carrier protein ThiS|nr:hypothetical protein [Burkholderiaceae bacterium]
MAVIPTLSVIWCPNPLRPASEREHKAVALMDGDTVQSIIGRLGLVDTPLAAALNGDPLDDAARWPQATVHAGDVLVLQQVARDFGASTIAAKLVMYGEMAYGTALALGTVLAFAANTVISMALSAIASSLMRKSAGSGQDNDNAPTAYSIEGGSNDARPYEPLPLVLGEHRIFPDYAGRPFAEFVLDPTSATDVINNTPQIETMMHPTFGFDDAVPPAVIEPWTQIKTDSAFVYYGDNAPRTYTSSNQGTVTQPHTFVVRTQTLGGAPVVATYEDYLVLIQQGSGGGDGGGGGG